MCHGQFPKILILGHTLVLLKWIWRNLLVDLHLSFKYEISSIFVAFLENLSCNEIGRHFLVLPSRLWGYIFPNQNCNGTKFDVASYADFSCNYSKQNWNFNAVHNHLNIHGIVCMLWQYGLWSFHKIRKIFA